jgi:phosphoglycerate dehydrogenase-like enzyme
MSAVPVVPGATRRLSTGGEMGEWASSVKPDEGEESLVDIDVVIGSVGSVAPDDEESMARVLDRVRIVARWLITFDALNSERL